jgi:hypothetical protein
VPSLNHAATTSEALAAVRSVLDEAHRAFADNPPPLGNLRLALLRLRRAAEAWSEAAAAASTRAQPTARGDDAGDLQRWGRAGAMSLSVLPLLTGEPLAAFAGCTSLLACPDPVSGRSVPLPGLHAALAAGDRNVFVSRTLTLINAAQAATQRLAEAQAILSEGVEQHD